MRNATVRTVKRETRGAMTAMRMYVVGPRIIDQWVLKMECNFKLYVKAPDASEPMQI